MTQQLGRQVPLPRFVGIPVLARLLLGGFLSQFGWIFLGFGWIFVWVFVTPGDFDSIRFSPSDWTPMKGQVLAVERTSIRVNKRRVFAVRYGYEVGGRGYEGVSYTTGRTPKEGKAVSIEIGTGDPERARISGLDRGLLGAFALFVLLFPGIGLAFVLYGLRKGLRAVRLVKHGRLALGTLVGREATNVRVNKRRVIRLTFQFQNDSGQTGTVEARTHEPEKLEDEAEEKLLYDPSDLRRAMMVDSLPGGVTMDDTGRINEGSPMATFSVCIVPGLSILGHGFYGWMRFFQ